MEWWNDGTLEYWVDESSGLMQGLHLGFGFNPLFHHSNIP
jgi:hypothetical protein